MRTTTALPVPTQEANEITFKHRDWQLIPDARYPNYFCLKEIKTDKILTHFVLYQSSDTKLLNRIACTPELEDVAEMYHDATTGSRAKAAALTTAFKHRDWQLIPNGSRPDWFDLEDTKKAKILGTFLLPEGGDFKALYRIVSAPKLERIAKTFRDTMAGSPAKESILFSVVTEVLRRIEQECLYTIAT